MLFLTPNHVKALKASSVPYAICYTLSEKTSHLWLAITLTHMNGFWYFFGGNVTDKEGNQKTLYYATLSNCASALPGKMGKRKNHIFTQLDCVTHIMHLCAVFLKELECEPMPCLMAALPNIGGALCWTPQFGWRPLLECRAVTLPRRETRWN